MGYRQVRLGLAACILSSTLVFGFQNCSSQFQLNDQQSEAQSILAFESPIIAVTATPLVMNSSKITIQFQIQKPNEVQVSVLCQLDSLSPRDCTNGTIEFTNLIDGDHTVKIMAKTTKNATSEKMVLFKVDTVAPTIQLTQTPSLLTANTNAQFILSVQDQTQTTLACSIDNAAFAPCSNSVNYTNLAEGSHVFKTKATDAAGNISQEATYSWQINLKVPSVTITSGPQAFSNTATASFSFTGLNSIRFECQVDSQAFTVCSSPQNITGLSSGPHVFRLRSIDSLGNSSSVALSNWTIDLQPPAIPTVTANFQSPTNSQSITIAISATDENGILKYECSLDTAPYVACVSPLSLANLNNGAHSLQVRAVDSAQNMSAVKSFSWVIDTIAPTLTLNQTPPPSAEMTSATFLFTATDNSTGSGVSETQCSLNGAAFSNCSSGIIFSGLVLGTYTAQFRVVDFAGNSSVSQFIWNVLSLQQGQNLYSSSCAGCHGPLASSTKLGATNDRIVAGIQTVSNMAGLKNLNSPQTQSIALALAQASSAPFLSQFQCDQTKNNLALTAPLKRMTSDQYLNTLELLFGKPYDSSSNSLYKDANFLISTYPLDALSKSGMVFDSAYSLNLAKAQLSIAEFIATQVSNSSSKAVSIGMTSTCFTTPSITCIKSFISSFGRMLLRRPLTNPEVDAYYTNLYGLGSSNSEKLRALVQGLMLDPEHLLIFETGNDTPVNGEIALTPFEVASRLSFQLINESPDDELLTAAANANFLTDAGMQAQIDRLIQSPKFKRNANRFLQYWLQVNTKSGYPSDLPDQYFNDPLLSDDSKKLQYVSDLKNDIADYFVGMIKGNFSYFDLMTSSIAFPTTTTAAKIYGLDPSQISGAQVNVSHRGLIQRPGFLLNANGNSNPIYRGKFILTQVLCQTIGSPADFSAVSAAPNLDPVYYNTRSIIENKTSGSACIGCHSQFNHFGFALEAFDGLGRFRNSEKIFLNKTFFNYRSTCNPNDTTIAGYNNPASDFYCPSARPPYEHALNLSVTPTFDSPKGSVSVSNPLEFARSIASSSNASACMAKNFVRFVSLEQETTENNCEFSEIDSLAHDTSQSLKNVLYGRLKKTRFKSRKVIQ